MAEKAKIRDWKDFGVVLLSAFLLTDYISGVGGKLRVLVPPTSVLGNLHMIIALCLNWKPDISRV